MAKGKSSASSATRKKQAAKAAKKHRDGGDDDIVQQDDPDAVKSQQPAQRGQKKTKQKKDRFAPKIKSYIPPAPPPKGQPDPVDLYLNGGANVDAELVVILRKLMKKDEATVGKGVEALDAWVRQVLLQEQEIASQAEPSDDDWQAEQKMDQVTESMQVWAHHFPRLALHPSRRIRFLVHNLHALLSSARHSNRPSTLLKYTRAALLAPVWIESKEYTGAWCCSAFDADRQIRSTARRSWDSVVRAVGEPTAEDDRFAPSEHADNILSFAAGLILTPSEPTDTAASSTSETDDSALLKTQALLAVSYLVRSLQSLPFTDDSLGFFVASDLWDLLDPAVSGSAALRRAEYELLGSIVARKEEQSLLDKDEGVKLVSGRVLKNCWSEDEGWAGVIAFLRRYPQAWSLADAHIKSKDRSSGGTDDGGSESGSEDDSDDEDDDEEEGATSQAPSAPASTNGDTLSGAWSPSPSLSLLFTHLSLGCSGSPKNYPTVLLLLSTVPSTVLPRTQPALDILFESFWAAWGGRALSGLSSSVASGASTPVEEFAAAFLECLVFESANMHKDEGESAVELVKSWTDRFTRAYLGIDREEGIKMVRSLQTTAVASQLERTLAKLAGKADDLFEAAWSTFADDASHQLALTSTSDALELALPALNLALAAFVASSNVTIADKGRALAVSSIKAAARGVDQDTLGERTVPLLAFIASARKLVEEEEDAQIALSDLASSRLAFLLSGESTSSLALSFMTAHLSSPSTSTSTRSDICSSIFKPDSAPSDAVLLSLIERVQEGELSDAGELPSAGLDDRVVQMAEALLAGERNETQMEIVKRLMLQSEPFVQPDTPRRIVSAISVQLPPLATTSLGVDAASSDLELLTAPLELLAHYTQLPGNVSVVVSTSDALPRAVFEIAHLLPSSRLEQVAGVELPVEAVLSAQATWDHLVSTEHEHVVGLAVSRCQEALLSTDTRCSSVEIVEIASSVLSTVPLTDLLPSPTIFGDLSQQLHVSPVNASLSILEPLVSQSIDDSPPLYPPAVDAASLPPFARAVIALFEVAARSDHAWVRSQMWSLPHVLFLADVSRDELACSGSTSGFFGRVPVQQAVLERLVGACDGLASYLISSSANALPSGWHVEAVKVVRAKEPVQTQDELVKVLDTLARKGRVEVDSYSRRAFSTVLQTVLRYAEGTVMDAERWLAWAQSLTGAPDLACAVIYAVKPILLESPRFERYQNELASLVAGVSSSAAGTQGLVLLRTLLATAPPVDAPIIFLPQQRSMFLIQAVQKWIASDDDLPEEIHSRVAELFIHLSPIVQELSGSHWDLVFDIIESNLETASWSEPVTLTAVFHSCRLLQTIKELASSNSELQATAKARIERSLELVRDLFVSRPESRARDQPRIAVLETMARLIRDLPPKLLGMGESFDSLLRLLRDPSLAVQRSAFDLVVRIAEKYVSDLVVEVELETETPPTISLPGELMALLSEKLSPELKQTPADYSKASTYMLAWLVAFCFFDSASPRIKSAYNDQIRRAALIPDSFLPSIFGLLNLSDRTRPVDISPWAVDEFHLELIDEVVPTSLQVFATFVYYRGLQAVPSLIRQWWESCKNRQLSIAVSSFTSKHFSPVLIAAELAHLRDPNDPAGQALRDNEDFVVKVAAGANEIKATFAIDEESMELGIRLPSEFPLQQVEIKDVRKVGVTDSQWRAWLLAVQQVITNQNGLIADALNIFKRNVVLHFEGVEACSICYSSISVVDRSLPSKACRTCNNRFHSGCLHRWFMTSHGASCPLCRSLF